MRAAAVRVERMGVITLRGVIEKSLLLLSWLEVHVVGPAFGFSEDRDGGRGEREVMKVGLC